MTDVMFPDGSPHLVEPIYKNPILSAPFNVQLAAALRSYVEDRLQVIFFVPGSSRMYLRRSNVLALGRRLNFISDMQNNFRRCCQLGRKYAL